MSEQHGAAPLLLVDIGNTRLKWRWVPSLSGLPGLPGPVCVPTDGVLPLAQVNTATLLEQFAAGRGGARE
ncbi:MAG: pantothenate kinase, partial [Gammaproteobacteria bacterium]